MVGEIPGRAECGRIFYDYDFQFLFFVYIFLRQGWEYGRCLSVYISFKIVVQGLGLD